MRIKVKSPYMPRQRGITVSVYDEHWDRKWRSFEVDPDHVVRIRRLASGSWGRESNFLVQVEPRGQWFEAIFNGDRISWAQQ